MKNKQQILKVSNMSKSFKTQKGYNKVLDNISFTLNEGQVLGLIGESGSGKTTIGKALIRLIPNYSGSVLLDNKIISGKKISRETKAYLHRNLQMIFQNPHSSLNPMKSIFSTLKEPLVVNKIISDEIIDLLKDFKQVNKYFKYSFLEEKYLISAKFSFESTNIFDYEFTKIIEQLNNFSIKKFTNSEEALEELFYIYYKKQHEMFQKVNNQLEHLIGHLLNLYQKSQKDLRNDKLNVQEQEYREAQKEFQIAKLTKKHSLEWIQTNEKFYEAKKTLKTMLKVNKIKINNTHKVIAAITKELKMEVKNFKNLMKLSISMDEYNVNFIQMKMMLFYISAFQSDAMQPFLYFSDNEIYHLKTTIVLLTKRIFEIFGAKIYQNSKIEQLTINEIEEKITWLINDFFKNNNSNGLNAKEQYAKKIANQTLKVNRLERKLLLIQKLPNYDQNEFQKAIKKYNLVTSAYKTWLKKELLTDIPRINQAKENALQSHKKQKELLKDLQQKSEQIFRKKLNEIFNLAKNNLESYKVTAKKILKNNQYDWQNGITNEFTLETIKAQLQSDFNKKVIKLTTMDFKTHFQNMKISYEKHRAKTKLLKKDYDRQRQEAQVAFMLFDSRKLYLLKYKLPTLLYKIKIYDTLREVGLSREYAFLYPFEFSGGQLQRIAIARALIIRPKIIIADEPIASLDISIQAQIVNLLKDLATKNNIAVIFIAHDLSMVQHLTEDILIIHLGKLVEFGSSSKIFGNPVHPYTQNLFNAIPKIANANEPFLQGDFNLDYLNVYSIVENPKYFCVEPNHFVLGIEEQVKFWKQKSLIEKQDSIFEVEIETIS